MKKLLEENEATGRTAEIYAEIKEKMGVLPNLFKAIAAQDETWLELNWEREKRIMIENTSLDRKTKELIAMAVCTVEKAAYGKSVHETLARMFGASDADVADAKKVAELFSSFGNIGFGLDVPIDFTPDMAKK